jgi:Tfp pilus assembly protein PilF
MNKVKIYSIAFFATTLMAKAQDVSPAIKAIDAEQFAKAKTLLKSTADSNGKAAFLLGNIYLTQEEQDSARIYFNKGLTLSSGSLNNIGLGQIDLNNNNATAAQTKFDIATKEAKKKDVEAYIYVARAYMNAEKPDFKKAIAVLNKAKEINANDAQLMLALGDAYYGDKNQNEAYVAYRSAYQLDSSLIRAKMQLGVLLKGARAFDGALKAYDEVIALNPNYGPVYRELAETYYLWAANQPKTYTTNMPKALESYEKYMQLTDRSLVSRMRHADFLIIAKDYKALEAEANEMAKLDKVNPRILRYLGYSAYENGNADAAINALNEYLVKGKKIIGGDYYYLGLAKVKKSVGADGKTIDATQLNSGLAEIKKSIQMDPNLANTLNEIGKNYFGQKLYGVAAGIFEAATLNPESKNSLEDNLYYALCVYSENRGKDAKTMNTAAMLNADKSLDNVITAKPDYPESYLYKARINSSLDKNDVMTANYQKYIDIVVAKGEEEIIKSKAKLTESYNSIAAHYANTDKAKAKEYFNKTLAIDPANKYANETIKLLEKK